MTLNITPENDTLSTNRVSSN